MIKPTIGTCTACKTPNIEIWEGYEDRCTDCFNKQSPSKFKIDDVPLNIVIESILTDRADVKRITDVAMMERGAHRILRLEEDGRIYKVHPEWHEQVVKTVSVDKYNIDQVDHSTYVIPADPELIPKLNKLIDEHISNCRYCLDILEFDQ